MTYFRILYLSLFLFSTFNIKADSYPILQKEYRVLYDSVNSMIKKERYTTAFEYLNKIKYAPTTDEKLYLQACSEYLEAEIYRKLLVFDKAEIHFLNSYNLFEKTNQKSMAYSAMFLLAATVESSKSRPEKMYEYSKKALDLALEIKDTFQIVKSYDAIGCSLFLLKQYDNAIESSKNAEKLMNLGNPAHFAPNVYTNIAEFYLTQNDYPNACLYIDKSIKHFGDESSLGWVNNAYRIAGTIYLKLGRTKDGMKYLGKALAFCKKNINNPHFSKKTFDIMIEEKIKKGNFEEAYLLQKEYAILKDSASKKEIIVRLNQNQILLDINNKDKERELLIANLENEKKQNRFTLGFIFLLATLLVTLFFFYSEKKDFNQKLFNEVERQTKVLTQKNIELERFAFITAHDLKTPLRNIISFSGLLNRKLKNSEDADILKYIKFVKDYAYHMNSIIENILEFSRIGQDAKSEIEEIDLNEIKGIVLESLKEKIKARNADIYTEGVLPRVKANKTHLIQLMQNLVENALVYNNKERPDITIGIIEDDSSEKLIFVKDNGIGIDNQYQEKVFEMFTRLHSIDKYPGTGLGLAICKKIVMQYGGRIWIDSQLDKGTTVNFALPMAA